MKQAILVFVGGGLGSVLRYFFGRWFNGFESSFAYGTLLANTVGCILIGMVVGYLGRTTAVSQTHVLLLATGFCGGFTTFSAFAYENHLILKSGNYLNFGLYTFGSILLGFVAVFVGLYISKLI